MHVVLAVSCMFSSELHWLHVVDHGHDGHRTVHVCRNERMKHESIPAETTGRMMRMSGMRRCLMLSSNNCSHQTYQTAKQ